MKPLMRLMVVVGSLALMPALLFVGPAAAAKGGSKATVQECKDHGAAFSNHGQCVSGARPTQAPGPAPSIQIEDPALLLSDNTVFMTVDYLCLSGSDGNTAGSLLTLVRQGDTVGSVTTAPATCDGRSHTASTGNGPGPFHSGPAQGFAQVRNSDGDGVDTGNAPITIKAPDPAAISIRNKALLLTDGTVIMTVDYVCLPAGDNTAGTLTTTLSQGQTVGSRAKAPATCDDRSHTATIDNGPGPFSEGPAQGFADVHNSAGDGIGEGSAPITISSFVPPTGQPAGRQNVR